MQSQKKPMCLKTNQPNMIQQLGDILGSFFIFFGHELIPAARIQPELLKPPLNSLNFRGENAILTHKQSLLHLHFLFAKALGVRRLRISVPTSPPQPRLPYQHLDENMTLKWSLCWLM